MLLFLHIVATECFSIMKIWVHHLIPPPPRILICSYTITSISEPRMCTYNKFSRWLTFCERPSSALTLVTVQRRATVTSDIANSTHVSSSVIVFTIPIGLWLWITAKKGSSAGVNLISEEGHLAYDSWFSRRKSYIMLWAGHYCGQCSGVVRLFCYSHWSAVGLARMARVTVAERRPL